MNIVLIPLWLLSGALFPVTGASPWVQTLMRLNPLSPAVDGLRALLGGGSLADLPAAALTVSGFAVVTLAIATLLVGRPVQS
jgi:ABC-2 type transport system permease protein